MSRCQKFMTNIDWSADLDKSLIFPMDLIINEKSLRERKEFMKNTKNTKPAQTTLSKIENHRGRFVSIPVTRNNKVKVYCAKVNSITSNYVTFTDVKTNTSVKVAKSSLV